MKSVIPRALAGSTSAPARTCSGASRRARASAVARSHWSADARTSGSCRRSARIGGRPSAGATRSSRRSRSRAPSSSSSHRSGSSSTVTPYRPSRHGTRPGGSVPPSTTNRRWGSGGRSEASSARSVETIRRGPTASERWPERAWGSHFTQSHSDSVSSEASTAIARCPGDWNIAAEQIIDRVSERAASAAPQISIRSKARRSTVAGRSGWTRCTASSRCSAAAAAGSTRSTAAEPGATRSSVSGWLHTAYRTCRNSLSVTVRSHTRDRSSASDGRDAGSGCRHTIAARCWAAA